MRAVPVGTVLKNPGGGTSEIVSYKADSVVYRRGKSKISAPLWSFFDAYAKYCGAAVSSTDLRASMPAVFDSRARPAGHSCNSTFLFVALIKMGLARALVGRGTRANPYSISLVGQEA